MPRSPTRPKPESLPIAAIAVREPLRDGSTRADLGRLTREIHGYRNTRGFPLVCQVTPEGPLALVGVMALAGVLRRGAQTIDAWLVPCSDAEAEAISALDLEAAEGVPWTRLSFGVSLLRGYRLPGRALAALLGLHPSEITRMTRAAGAGERLSAALAKGQLTPAHARLLAKLPGDRQSEWTERTIAGGWSYRKLVRMLQDNGKPAVAAPNLDAFATRLAEKLGAQVRLEWPDTPTQRRLVLTWYGPEDLKGILAQLAAGPETASRTARRRELSLSLDSVDELDALTGHLADG